MLERRFFADKFPGQLGHVGLSSTADSRRPSKMTAARVICP